MNVDTFDKRFIFFRGQNDRKMYREHATYIFKNESHIVSIKPKKPREPTNSSHVLPLKDIDL